MSFNIIGTIIFVTISLLFPFADIVASLTPGNVPAQIANVHTIFNIGTTILLLPFGKQLVDLSYKLLPKRDEDIEIKRFLLMIIILELVQSLIDNYSMKFKIC